MKTILLILLLQPNPMLGKSIEVAINHYKEKGCTITEQVENITYCDCPTEKVRLYHDDEKKVNAVIIHYK